MNNEKIGKKKRITTCLGDWIGSGTLFANYLRQGSLITFCMFSTESHLSDGVTSPPLNISC